MFWAFADWRKPRFRREQASYPGLPYYRVMNDDSRAVSPEAFRGNLSRSGSAKIFIVKVCRKVGSSLKSCLRKLARCIPLLSLAESNDFSEIPCPSMEEVERLLADLESVDMGSPYQDSPSSLKTDDRLSLRTLSPSMMPAKCSTAPEICLWAGSISFRAQFAQLKRAVIHQKEKSSDAVRQLAILNLAYRTRWYAVHEGMGYKYPQGTTGKKSYQRKLPSGAKGLKRPGQWGIPADKDIYVPTNGMSRKLENRPEKGRWFYPQPSSLRQEFKPE